jgi:hypothetical protein
MRERKSIHVLRGGAKERRREAKEKAASALSGPYLRCGVDHPAVLRLRAACDQLRIGLEPHFNHIERLREELCEGACGRARNDAMVELQLVAFWDETPSHHWVQTDPHAAAQNLPPHRWTHTTPQHANALVLHHAAQHADHTKRGTSLDLHANNNCLHGECDRLRNARSCTRAAKAHRWGGTRIIHFCYPF